MTKREQLMIVLKIIYGFLTKPLTIIENCNPNFSGLNGILFADNMSKNSEYYYQYARIKKTCNESLLASQTTYEDVGIVVQGPIMYEDDFTLTTLSQYIQYFPKCKVILSTWENEQTEFIEKCENMGVYIVKNKLPEQRGAGNLNCQLISSLQGVKAAKRLGCHYVAKTRSDQRIASVDWIQYMKSLLHVFTVKGNKQAERIVFLESNGSYKYIAFHLCDFFTFGNVNDMEKFYNTPLDNRDNSYFKYAEKEIETLKQELIPYEISRELIEIDYLDIGKKLLHYQIAEFYIVFNYVSTCIFDDITEENMLKKYYDFLAEYAILVDATQLQFYWPKYRRRYEVLSKIERNGKLDFAAWLNIYSQRYGLND